MSDPIDWYSNISDLKFGNGSFYIGDKIKEIEEEYAKKAFDGFDLSKLKN